MNKRINLQHPYTINTLCLLLFISFGWTLTAQSVWNGGNSNWNIPSNWTPVGVPSSGSHVTINSGTVTLNATDTVASLTLNGGILQGNFNMTLTGNMSLNAGTFSNIGDLDIGGTFSWTGGNLGNGTNAGTITVAGLTTISTALGHFLNNKTLILNGGADWTGGSIFIDNGGLLRNPAGQTLTETATNSNITHNSGAAAYFENYGTFLRNGTGTLSIDRNFTNNGSVQLNNGTLALAGASTHNDTGTIAIANGATLEFSTVAHTLNNVTFTGTGTGTVKLSGGTLNLTGDVTFPALNLTGGTISGTANLDILAGFSLSVGTIINVGDINIGGTFSWTGGTLGSNTVGGIITVAGLATISSANHFLQKKTLILNGGASWTGGTIFIDYDGLLRNPAGQVFTETSTVTNLSMASQNGTTGYFENLGTFIHNGTGTLTITRQLTNTGSIEVNSGTLLLSGISTHPDTSTIAIANGATLEFDNVTHNLNGVTFTGTGTGIVKLTTGTLSLTGNVTFPALNMVGGTISGTGNLNILGSCSLAAGVIINVGDLNIGGTFSWTGGTLGSNTVGGIIEVAGLTTISTANHFLQKKTLILNGGASWTGGTIYIDYDGLLRNPAGQVFTATGTANLNMASQNGTTGYFENFGTFIHNGTGTLTINRNLTNTGTIQVNSSTLLLSGTGTHSNTSLIAVQSGATIEFGANTHSLNGVSLSGTGTLKVSGGTVLVDSGTSSSNNLNVILSGGTFTDNASFTWVDMTISGSAVYNGTSNVTTSGNMTMSGGTLTNVGDLNIGGTFSWTGGTLGSNTVGGIITAAGLATISTTYHFLQKKTLILNGGASWTGGTIYIDYDGLLRNTAGQVFTETGTANLNMASQNGTTGYFENFGTFIHNGTGTLTINRQLTNTGSIEVNSGTLLLSGISTHPDTSTIAIANGATLEFSTVTHNLNGVTFTGTGTGIVKLSGGTLSLTGNVTFPALNMTGGTISGTSNLNILGSCSLAAGVIINVGDLNIGGTFSWTGGTLGTNTVGGNITVAGLTTISTVTSHYLYKKTLILNGGADWTGGTIYIDYDGLLRNPAGQVFTETSTVANLSMSSQTGTNGYFENLGTFLRNGTGTLTITRSLTNTGTIQVNSNTLLLSGISTHSDISSLVIASGATLEFATATHNLNGSALSGSGTFKVNGGTVIANIGTTVANTLNAVISSGTFTDYVGFTWASITVGGTYNGPVNIVVEGDMIVSGNLLNDGDVSIGGALTWTGGSLGPSANPRTITVTGLTTISSASHFLNNRTLILNGGGNWTGGVIYMDNNGYIRNPAGKIFTEATSSSSMIGSSTVTGYFENDGTFLKNGTGNLNINRDFTNTGSIEVNNGALQLNRNSTHSETSNIAIANSASIDFSGFTHSLNGTAITGTATVKAVGGTVTANTGTTISSTMNAIVSGATFTDYVGFTWASMTMSGTYNGTADIEVTGNLSLSGTLVNDGDVNVGGTLTWSGGSLGNSTTTGTVTVAGLTTFSVGTHFLNSRTLILNGGANWTGGVIYIDYNGILRNPAGKTFTENVGTTTLGNSPTLTGQFENFGTLAKNIAGTLTISRIFTNSGLIQVGAGTINITGTFTNSATGVLEGNSPGAYTFNNLATFTNNGAISPGISGIGTLGMTRNTLPVKILNIDIVAPTQKDLLAVTGNIDVTGGILNVTETPCLDNGTYDIITYTGTLTGTFTATNLPPGYTIVYNTAAKKVQLVYLDPPPTITCPTDVTVVNDAGLCSASNIALGTPNALDNCPGVISSNDALVTFPIGNSTVTWTATDVKAQTATCTQAVTINDLEPPVLTCPPVSITSDPGFCSAVLTDLGASATDNCNLQSLVDDGNSPYAVGVTIVTHTATDIYGNSNTCAQVITVTDDEMPEITCPENITTNNDSGECTAALTVPAASAADNCGIQSITNDGLVTYPVGTTTVTHTATDIHGNTTTCEQTVVVSDNEMPVITCPANIVFNNTPGACQWAMIAGLEAATATDNCGVQNISNEGLAIYPVGTTTVMHTATDIHGNSSTCEQIVTVNDTEAPVIDCPDHVSVNNDPGECFAALTVPAALAADNCGIENITNDGTLTYAVGTTTVTHTATDIHGNSSICVQFVTVTDNELPVITCPADTAVNNDPGECFAALTVPAASAADNCGIESITNNGPATYLVGTTTVVHTVTDLHGNTTACEQAVTVTDNESPVITCPENEEVDNEPGTCDMTLMIANATATDNCGVQSINNNGLSVYPVGTTTVVHTATDIHGNSSTCEQIVTVNDTEAPVIDCPDHVSVNNDPGECFAALTVSAALATDNCGIESITNDGTLTYAVGTTTVTHTATDIHGNSSICVQMVTVSDVELPVVTCPADTVVNNDPGECFAALTVPAASAADNCGIESITNDGLATYLVGTTTVVHTATDLHGNTTACEQAVTVTDNESPVITCPENEEVDNEPGTCGMTLMIINATATDNCGVQSINNNGLSIYPVGATTVIHTATDIHGNSSTCEQIVTVNDTEAPTIDCPDHVSVNNDPGECFAALTVSAALAADNCGIESINNNGTATYSVGTTTVIHTATDIHGNTSTCEQMVTVTDNELPVVTCPADTVVNNDPGECFSTLIVPAAIASDNCGIQSIINDVDSAYPVGTTTVVHTVTDIHGNTTTCEQIVMVSDNEMPVITCPANIVFSSLPGTCQWVLVTEPIDATATDNCGVQSINNNGLSEYPVGATTVIHTATDIHGNSSSCEQIVTVNDTEAPVIDCPDHVSVNNDPGECFAALTVSAALATDNCGIESITNDGTLTYAVGTTTVVHTATDIHGNSTICVQMVTVTDNEIPEITCPGDTVVNNDPGECFSTLIVPAAIASDNCGIQSIVNDVDSAYPAGTTTVVQTATDIHGNTITCDHVVTVILPDEVCNGVDDDCDGLTDNADPGVIGQGTYYIDNDSDGYGNISQSQLSCTNPIGYVTNSTDCYDADPAVNPNSTEVCNGGVDDDCDTFADDDDPGIIGQGTYYIDNDGDSYGDITTVQLSCLIPAGYTSNNTDCNDTYSSIYPGAAEACNGLDDNCDNITDNVINCPKPSNMVTSAITSNSAIITWDFIPCATFNQYRYRYLTSAGTWSAWSAWFTLYTNSTTILGLTPGTTYQWVARTKCYYNYSATTSGVVFTTLTNSYIFYQDGDSDGYGNPGITISQSTPLPPVGYVENNSDCNDSNAGQSPATAESCNGIDDNCDLLIDNVTTCPVPTGLASSGVTNVSATISWTAMLCSNTYEYRYRARIDPVSWSAWSAWIPAMSNSAVMEGLNPGTTYQWAVRSKCISNYSQVSISQIFTTFYNCSTYYLNNDNDYFGVISNTITLCDEEVPPGYSIQSGDCNDADPTIYPYAYEACDDIDNDCDLIVDNTTWCMYISSAIQVTERTTSSATFSWEALSCAIGYEYRYRPYCDYYYNPCEEWSSWIPVDSPSINITGLLENSWYIVEIRPDCGFDYGYETTINIFTCDSYEIYTDNDLDGWGDYNLPVVVDSCYTSTPPQGYSNLVGDCNDNDATVFPGALELCDGIDNDCDPFTADAGYYYLQDYDGDGYGDYNSLISDCSSVPPPGYINVDYNSYISSQYVADCDDNNAGIHPEVPDVCNNIDDNCNGYIDEEGPICHRPTSIVISNITNTSAVATWNDGACAYYYIYRYRYQTGPTNWSPWSNTNYTFNQDAYLTGLTPGTTYQFQVASVCRQFDENDNLVDIYSTYKTSQPFTTMSAALISAGYGDIQLADPQAVVTPGKVTIYPNPTADYITASFIVDNDRTSVNIIVSDPLGSDVLSINRTLNKGNQEEDIDLSKLPDGWYTVQFYWDNRMMNYRVLKTSD